LRVWVWRKYGATCGSKATSPAVAKTKPAVGTQCLPRAKLAAKSHTCFGHATRSGVEASKTPDAVEAHRVGKFGLQAAR
jgi:hypothetical protein